MTAFKDRTGQRFGRLVAQYPIREKGGLTRWMCMCDCGNETIVVGQSLTTGNTVSCGCKKQGGKIPHDLSGKVFGKLTVIKMAPKIGTKCAWLCKCECGNEIETIANSLTSYKTKSCGCICAAFTKRMGERNRVMDKHISAIVIRLRSCCYNAFKRKRLLKKKSKSEDLLCASFLYCQQYISDKFSDGMTWDNHGEWHLDHILPMAYAKTQEEAEILCHHTNLQPMWGQENLIKHDTLPENAEEMFQALKQRVEEYRAKKLLEETP